MAQVLDRPLISGNPAAVQSNAPLISGPVQQEFDLLAVLWRWKWLPVLGLLLGAGLGYLYYAKQPEKFRAIAVVQVTNPIMSAVPVQVYDSKEMGAITRTDESIVIRSQAVMRAAVEIGQLIKQPLFQAEGMTSNDEVVAFLMMTDDLEVEPAAKDVATTLIKISFISEDQDLSAAVVNAIVDGYGSYLSEQYQTVGKDVYDLINKAQTQLADRYKDLFRKNSEFRTNAPDVIWTGDKATDPYAETFLQFKRELNSLEAERCKLEGILTHAEEAQKAGRAPESILVMIPETAEIGATDLIRLREQHALASSMNSANRESEKIRTSQILPLQLQEARLIAALGDEHPSVVDIRRTIQALEKHAQELAESEETQIQQLAQTQQAFEEEYKEAAVTSADINERLQIRLNALKEKFAAIQLQEKQLQKLAAENQAKSRELQHFLNQNSLLQSELESVQKMLDAYTEKLKAIELTPQYGQRKLNELTLPSTGVFYGPHVIPYLLGGAFLGLVLLSGLAVLMDLADRSYRSPEEIAADMGMPVLGHIPNMDLAKVKKVIEAIDPALATVHHSRGRVSEAYRTVRTGLFFSNRGSELKVLQVTSPVPGDGKSTLAANLAVTMAQSGRRVLLIDADFRRPRIAKVFGIEADVGMAAVVAGKAELEDATYESHVANLWIMPGGKRPNNPAELLSSGRFQELIDVIRDRYDMVIMDTPPLLAVSDPCAIAAIVDGVIMTMRLRRNVKTLAARAVKMLESVDARVLGVVVNGVSADAGHGYSYGYNDYRNAYRYGGYRYGYSSYSAGYIDDAQEFVVASDKSGDSV